MAGRGGGGVEVRVDADRIGKTVDALLRWAASAKEQQRVRLLDEDQLLYLVISLNKIPEKSRVSPHRIPIPHPLVDVDGSQEICLIVNDLSRGIPRKEAKQRVLEEGLRVSKVLGFSKIKKDYASHESKRKLCGSYDLFLVDRRVQTFLSQALGKVFFKKKKIPIPVDLSKGQWKSQFEKVCSSTFLFISTGSCSVVKAAKVSQTREEIVENLQAVIDGVVSLMPKKWDSIQALYLKTLDSLALPMYQSKPSFPLKIDANFGRKSSKTTSVTNVALAPVADPGSGRKSSKTSSVENVAPVDPGSGRKSSRTTSVENVAPASLADPESGRKSSKKTTVAPAPLADPDTKRKSSKATSVSKVAPAPLGKKSDSSAKKKKKILG